MVKKEVKDIEDIEFLAPLDVKNILREEYVQYWYNSIWTNKE